MDRTIDSFSKILGEIDERGGELDFRDSFLRHFVRDVLDWKKKKGEGHYITREREDIRLHDDADNCVALIETKNPKNKLKESDREELEEHLDDISIARYGMLTNGRRIEFFEYSSEGGLNELVSIDMEDFVSRGADSLSESERQDVYLLRRLVRDRFIKAKPKEFIENAQKIPVEEKFDLFIEDLRASLDELTWIIGRLFRFYWKASPQHYGGKFLREDAYKEWKGASTGKEEELREKFWRETAYVFLNRILFTRILEDKKILEPRVISGEEFAKYLQLAGSGAYRMALNQAYKNVEKFYEHFYELGIFDWWRLPEDKRGMLSDEEEKVQEEIEEELFTVVIRDVLRNLNKYDFRGVNRDILGDVYQEYLPPEERKRLGEFYTPIEVVRYILDAVDYTPENKIEDKLLLDPACGSGTFLVEASNRLIDRYDEKGLRLRDSDDCKTILSAITNNIHGLDINPFACHIAEMNLLFNIIDLLNAVQRKYKDYKLDRFKISCTDSLIPTEDVKTIEDFANGRVKARIEEVQQSKGMKKKKYDFVVGNPPYVRVQTLPKEIREKYSETYKTAFGNYDIYIPFLERGVLWLSNKGKLGYITPNRFATVNYGKRIRKFLIEDTKIIEFLDFRDTGVFEDVLNYPAIIITANQKDEKNIVKACRMIHKPEDIEDEEVLSKLRDHLKKISSPADFSSAEMFDVFGYEQEMLTEEGWHLMPSTERNIFQKVEEVSTRLVEFSKTKKSGSALSEGSSTGAKKIYVVKRLEEKNGLSKFLCSDDGSTYTIENDLLRRYAEDSGKWHLPETYDFLIFPYLKKKEGYEIIPLNKIAEKYPAAQKYFKQKKGKLTDRKGFKKKENWHAYSAPRSLDYYEEEKILVQGFSVFSSASIDEEGKYFFGPDIYGLRVKDEYKDKSRYILAIINSSLTNFYIRHVGVVHGSGYYKFEDRFIKSLPIKLPETSKEKKEVKATTQKVREIIEITKHSEELSRRIGKFPRAYPLKNLKKLADRAEGYDLEKKRYKIRNLAIEKLGDGGFELSFGNGARIRFATREMAEFVLEWLKDKSGIKRKELLDFEIPSEKEVAKIMKEFSKDKEKVKELENKRDKLEKDIDDLVYELYGLDEKDQKIIEEFLEKF